MARQLFKVPSRATKEEDKRLIRSTQDKRKTGAVVISSGNSLSDKVKRARQLANSVFKERKKRLMSIQDEDVFDAYIDSIIENGICALDTETADLEKIDVTLAGVCLYTPGQKGAYVPVGHISHMTHMPVQGQLSKEKVAEGLKKIKDAGVKVIYHNSKFDMHVTESSLGLYIEPYFDTLTAGWLLNENEPHSLKELYHVYLDEDGQKAKFNDLFDGIPFTMVPLDVAYLYASFDSIMTWELYEFQLQFLDVDNPKCKKQKLEKVAHVFWDIEMPLIPVVWRMERRGVVIDMEMAKDLKTKYSAMLKDALATVDSEIAKYKDDIDNFRRDNPSQASKLDYPVNIGSPTQIAILFYDVLKLKSPDKDKPRGTGKDIMKALDHPIGNAILEYRKVDKLLSTYIDAIPAQVNKGTGRLHCNYNPIGAKTGRFSSSDPNLQNIPSHNKDIRPMFTVEKGWVMIGSDFSQQEPRILAYMSGDEHMKQAYIEGQDLYATVASALYHVPYDQCLEFDKDGNPNPEGKKRRSSCKSVLLGLMYGRGEASIAEQMGVSNKEAKKIISDFFERFPKVADFVVDSQNGAWENGYVETIAGRKRRLPDMQLDEYEFRPMDGSKNENFDPLNFDDDEEIDPNYVPQRIIDKYVPQLQRAWGKQRREIMQKANAEGYWIVDNGGKIADAERQCVNSRIQGSAADMTKIAMIMVDNDPIMQELDFHLLIPVHDELLGECPRHNAEEAGKRLSQLMIEAGKTLVHDIPQKCDVEITERWYGNTLTEEDLEEDETENATE